MAAELNTEKFEDFIAEYPIYEYRLLDTKDLSVAERVRIVCKQECERYGTTWPVRQRLVRSKSAKPASTVMTGPSFFPVLRKFLIL